ncbi:indole-3-glycerol phosphate synthase TrpC [Chengkuizengella axinellae]|uniref:Indole-3-glycerol phosphate synthase n=1 Tax=Chengkuizengella axinellae TaxID=3064388 RepID=A0ABT9IYB7_9BACL|nr:indole-3-glycerol phosphate synthase TrpC [Chengkuizengella sp. 2205SS18-9]MDP5273810.1 indole-3-glycerol phosphate synthase TrpC [Chengkuizengella sp. 2205SS18-9]
MILDKIVATKKEEVERLKAGFSIQNYKNIISTLPPCKGFEKALTETKNRSMGLIAEVKKASPSKGLIREDFNPVEIAKSYESAGADCLSVLTDEQYFQGSLKYLKQVREAVSLPILRKEFIIDPLQIYEARIIGADAILLIAAILTVDQMREFAKLSSDLGMDTLIEVHDMQELEQVLSLDVSLIGINNRNLKTFVTDINTTNSLIQHIPNDVTVVSESGISNAEQIHELLSIGAGAVLVGEHFMRQESVEQAVNQLMGERQ